MPMYPHALDGSHFGPEMPPHLDWEIEMSPVLANHSGSIVEVPGRRVVLGPAGPLDVVGSRWHPLHNREIHGFATTIASACGGSVTHSGQDEACRRFWCRVGVSRGRSLIVTAAHTGGGAVTVTPFAEADGALLRVGSWNGESWPHGPTLEARIGDGLQIGRKIDIWVNESRDWEKLASRTKLQPGVFVDACSGMFPSRARTAQREANRRAVLNDIAGKWQSRSGGEMDAWTALVAISLWLDEERPALPADRRELSFDIGGWVARAKSHAWGTISSAVASSGD